MVYMEKEKAVAETEINQAVFMVPIFSQEMF